MEKQFKIGDLVRMDFDGYDKRCCPKYGVIIEIGSQVPPTSMTAIANPTQKPSPYISVMWMGKDRKHTIYKNFLKKMWERVEVIANA
jgi:hypothetical protein